MSTTENSFRTKEFRGKLKPYNIDHIVEFRILVAVLLENKMDSEIQICENFTEYFNQSWNRQILPKSRHSDKGSKVFEYIRFKFGQTESEPKREILDEISNIFSKYNKERPKIKEYFKSIEGNDKVYLNLEESLCNFLNINNKERYKIPIDEIQKKSLELKGKFKQNSIDHIVELQILTYVLANSKVNSNDLALKFIKYFHENWNFKEMDRDTNKRKGQMVQNWIKWIKRDPRIKVDNEMFVTITTISNHYKNNIDTVKKSIDKNELIIVADDLLALFENNIPF